MRPKEISLNIQHRSLQDPDDAGEDHIMSSTETPMRPDAFVLSDDEKIKQIEKHFASIMDVLGLDLTDDGLRGTPHRVAQKYVKEVFSGLNPRNRTHARLFITKYAYDQMLAQKDITFYSTCEHHLVPDDGNAHVGYLSSGKVIGLSKTNRCVEYFAKRPLVQD